MAYTFVNQVSAGSGGGSGVTTGAVNFSSLDSTGLIVLCVASYEVGSIGVTDSQSNVYDSFPEEINSGDGALQIFYKFNPSVSSSMTFEVTGANNYPSIVAMGFTGAVTSPADQDAAGGLNTGGTTVQPGSITPSEDNELIIAALCHENTGAGGISINSGFVDAPYQVAHDGAGHYGVAASYLIQTSAGAINPTFTSSASVALIADQVSFKAGGAAVRRWILGRP